MQEILPYLKSAALGILSSMCIPYMHTSWQHDVFTDALIGI